MESQRKYRDSEIRQILELAMGQEAAATNALTSVDGLTLQELRDVGQEVGLPHEKITRAVATFEGKGELAPRRTTVGLPTSVGTSVAIPRNPSEREWELLVAEFRTTFGGKGVVTSNGGLREWSHGNLHVFIEPTEFGHRLRMVDKSAAIAGIALGGFFVVLALTFFAVLLGKVNPGFKFAIPGFFGFIGGALTLGSAISLPKWAQKQESLMERVNQRAVSLLSAE